MKKFLFLPILLFSFGSFFLQTPQQVNAATCSFSVATVTSNSDAIVGLTGQPGKYTVYVVDPSKNGALVGQVINATISTGESQKSITLPQGLGFINGHTYTTRVGFVGFGPCSPSDGQSFTPGTSTSTPPTTTPPPSDGSPSEGSPSGPDGSGVITDATLSKVTDPTGGKFSLGGLITNALVIVFTLVGFLAVIVFSIGALRYLTSRGDPKAVDSARGTMTGSVIGLVIVLGSAAVSGVFEKRFGISFFGGSNEVGKITNNSFDLSCAFQLATGNCVGKDYQSFGELVTQILLALLAVGCLAFFFMLLWGGLRYMIARGDEKAVSEARSTLTNAAVGLLLLISALVIIRLIAQVVFNRGGLIT